MGSPVLWGPNNIASNLESGIQFSGSTGPSIQTGTVTPTTTATDAIKGSLYLNSSTGLVFIKNDNGSTTNWSLATGSTPVVMRTVATTTHSATPGTNYGWDAPQYDTASALNYSAGIYTIPYSDYYYVGVSVALNAASDIFVAVNGTSTNFVASPVLTTNYYGNGSTVKYFSAGDQVSIQPDVTTTVSAGLYSFWEIFRIPATVAGGGGGSGITRSVSSISTPTTAGATALTDYVYLVSGTTTLTLPTAVGNTNRYSVTNVGTNTVTVATTSSQTINGSSTATLPIANMSLDFVSDGSNWIIE